ncbi:DegT/DnrJ/EryC1/StrS family aminotransferase [Mesorhizobium sp. M1060]|uniref:DegT/DnrJ/EryC1/StrS family aminotransferase n=1 Tax=unclassified Mesorhizobium TaxID=325217 RepID=UPI0003CE52F9|nr:MULTISPECIES: DegT/DnrJ/EryC1/StrS family aminotransferase [unclassified Mesorhizobium]ESX58294.1 Pleiotropic regulatory protein [Mesorhizobium sp. LSHC422A00]ESZ41055.1 Pleiotropic regulatory protein [Mesorhizobium sp. L103C565B0]
MIPFVDLKAQYTTIKLEVDAAIQRTLESCQFTLGADVAEFEKEFAAYSQAAFGVGVNTGTSALHLGLLAAGIGPGDEVITSPFTFVATVAAIYYTGATPVLVDIDPATYTIDPAQIEAAVTPATKAIIPIHLYGQPADMDPIMAIARKHGLMVLEDACQAHGAEYKGKRVGAIGDMAAFSFYPGKNLGAYGEGGMLTTNIADHNRAVRMLRDWGAERKYHHEVKGYNYRLEGLQGAVLRVKLKHLDRWTEQRRATAARYDAMFAGIGLSTPFVRDDVRHVYHIYAVRTPDRARWGEALNAQGIQSGIHYPIPVHLLPAYADLGYKQGQFPHAEKAAAEVLSLPMFPELTEQQQDAVVAAVIELQASVERAPLNRKHASNR